MKKLIMAMAVGTVALVSACAANAADRTVRANTDVTQSSTDISSQGRHYGYRHYGYRHYGYGHRHYRPYYRSYGYAPRRYYGGGYGGPYYGGG